jgi:hypothetical protein
MEKMKMNKILIAIALSLTLSTTSVFAAAANDAHSTQQQQTQQCVSLEQDAAQFREDAGAQQITEYSSDDWIGNYHLGNNKFDTLRIWSFRKDDQQRFFFVFFLGGCRVHMEGPVDLQTALSGLKQIGIDP